MTSVVRYLQKISRKELLKNKCRAVLFFPAVLGFRGKVEPNGIFKVRILLFEIFQYSIKN